MTSAPESWPVRFWRLIHPGGPLVRPWDRWEARLLVVAILLAVAAVPLAGLLVSGVYARQSELAREQQADRTQVTAVVLADAGAFVAGGPAVQVTEVPALWRLPDGTERSGPVSVPAGTDQGTRLPIWIDGAGEPVPPPLSAFSALSIALGVGLLGWLGVVLVLTLAVLAVHLALDRVRAAAWAREWETLSQGRSGR
ncbi:Rv1733c family protein [Amycolatopsis thermoflava]|uniref:Rv1733c family protein n=1 Tax=Amycolatopsis thermoflava TaxID=84480 RepID=UPI003F49D799